MKKKAVHIFAKWQVKEGQLESVLSLLAALAEESRKEEGNLFYKIHQSLSDTHTLILSEAYADETALDVHRGSAHFKNFVLQQIVPLLEKREVEITNEVLVD
ncbi:MAG: putative quinol monooxygenase [Agriterribacter sp.]